MSITVRVDSRAVWEALDALDRTASKRALQKATAVGAKFLKPKVKAETPLGPGHFGYHLRNKVSAGTAKRGKPASIVKYSSAREHWLLGGTRGHRIRFPNQKAAGVPKEQGNIVHPGAKANDVIGRVADQNEDQVLDLVERELIRQLGLD